MHNRTTSGRRVCGRAQGGAASGGGTQLGAAAVRSWRGMKSRWPAPASCRAARRAAGAAGVAGAGVVPGAAAAAAAAGVVGADGLAVVEAGAGAVAPRVGAVSEGAASEGAVGADGASVGGAGAVAAGAVDAVAVGGVRRRWRRRDGRRGGRRRWRVWPAAWRQRAPTVQRLRPPWWSSSRPPGPTRRCWRVARRRRSRVSGECCPGIVRPRRSLRATRQPRAPLVRAASARRRRRVSPSPRGAFSARLSPFALVLFRECLHVKHFAAVSQGREGSRGPSPPPHSGDAVNRSGDANGRSGRNTCSRGARFPLRACPQGH